MFSIIAMYIHVALTRIQNKAFLPSGSYASISDLYVFPMSPPNMYQTPSITNDLASLKKNKIGFDGIRKYVDWQLKDRLCSKVYLALIGCIPASLFQFRKWYPRSRAYIIWEAFTLIYVSWMSIYIIDRTSTGSYFSIDEL